VKVASHLGDKPSRPQTIGQQANWATTNWATLLDDWSLGDMFWSAGWHESGQLGDACL